MIDLLARLRGLRRYGRDRWMARRPATLDLLAQSIEVKIYAPPISSQRPATGDCGREVPNDDLMARSPKSEAAAPVRER